MSTAIQLKFVSNLEEARRGLVLAEEMIGRQDGNQEKAEYELREFLPQKCAVVPYCLGLPAAGPVDCMRDNDKVALSVFALQLTALCGAWHSFASPRQNALLIS